MAFLLPCRSRLHLVNGPLSVVPKSCQSLWAPFPTGKLYILNQGGKHILLEAFLEEGFLWPEIILTGCLICPIKDVEPNLWCLPLRSRWGCRQVCLVLSSSVKSVLPAWRVLPIGGTQTSPNNDNIHLSHKNSLNIYYKLGPT